MIKEHSLTERNIFGFPKQLSKVLVRASSGFNIGGAEICIGDVGNVLNFPKDIRPRVNTKAFLMSGNSDGTRTVTLVKGRVYWENDGSMYEAKAVDQDGVIVGEDNIIKRILG